MEVGCQIHVPTALTTRENPRHGIRSRVGPRAGLDGFILLNIQRPQQLVQQPKFFDEALFRLPI
jgi:hypothetical protein